MEALFTSLAGGGAIRERLLELVDRAAMLAATRRVELHAMIFSFTDEVLADALIAAAARGSGLTIRIIADWSQRVRARGQQAGRLADCGLANLRLRYTKDQPYIWDPAVAHMRWSYRASRGLLHHKTLGLTVDGRPWQLICGSFNWTANAAQSYDNLLVVSADDAGSAALMTRMELEFAALWTDRRMTLSPGEAHRHYQAILGEYQRDPTLLPAAVTGLSGDPDEPDDGEATRLPLPCLAGGPPADPAGAVPVGSAADASVRRVAIAFNARQTAGRSRRGHADANHAQRLQPSRPMVRAKIVPLTITNLALDVILAAAPAATLSIAMYGLSARVPEFGALLDAARRGVRLRFLLDAAVGAAIASRLAAVGQSENLPIEIRTAGRMMHQKYIIDPAAETVLTGTANLTTDASSRHFEHRILVARDARLTEQFLADFETIWSRLSPA